MNTRISTGMAKATELTKAGKLQEATALIQSLMAGGAVPAPADTASYNDDVIEGTFTREKTPSPRFSLAKTLGKIASGGMPGSHSPAPGPVDLPAGAQFLTLTHQGKQGSRDYRLYVPSKAGKKLPLVVMLHGCTQTAEDFAIGTGMNAVAEVEGCLVAYPTQPSGANMQKCWNWFRPEDQVRGQGEPALIAGMVADILRDHGGDPTRVYIAGLSAGGAAAAAIADAYPDVFAAAGSHSGLPVGAARDVPSAFAAMRSGAAGAARKSTVPLIVFQGSTDATVHPDNGAALVKQALATLPGLEKKRSKGTAGAGHKWQRTRHEAADGRSMVEFWQVQGAGHAWAGGQAQGSYTDPKGPDASAEMLRFFLQHRKV